MWNSKGFTDYKKHVACPCYYSGLYRLLLKMLIFSGVNYQLEIIDMGVLIAFLINVTVVLETRHFFVVMFVIACQIDIFVFQILR